MKLHVSEPAAIQFIVDSNNSSVCRMSSVPSVSAAHIVHCVNNHDALVESLHDIASACSHLIEYGEFSKDGPMAQRVNDALDLVNSQKEQDA